LQKTLNDEGRGKVQRNQPARGGKDARKRAAPKGGEKGRRVRKTHIVGGGIARNGDWGIRFLRNSERRVFSNDADGQGEGRGLRRKENIRPKGGKGLREEKADQKFSIDNSHIVLHPLEG